jgi:hypothetical protein
MGKHMDMVVYLPIILLVPKAFDNLYTLLIAPNCRKKKTDEKE